MIRRQPLGFAAIFIALGGTSFAATGMQQAQSSGTRTFIACAAKKNGAMRLVKTAKKCTRKETAISFSSQGPRGLTGPTGLAGPNGDIGPRGDKGEKGDMGVRGDMGFKGDKGEKGETGATGPAGADGKAGADGSKMTAVDFSTRFNSKFGDLFGYGYASGTSDAAPGIDHYLGDVWQTANNFPPPGTAVAAGQTLSISQNTALFALLGTTYGGNGGTNFQLPDLRSQAPGGTSYVIAIRGIFPSR